MSRILIISEHWPLSGEGWQPAEDLRGSGREAVVMTNEGGPGARRDDGIATMRIGTEPARSTGFLFGVRNALSFGSTANEGNYAMLRETLHMHLQEVLYDAAIISATPEIYLKLGHWIARMFGIPVWFHLNADTATQLQRGFAGWNHRRLRAKYLAAAKLITTDAPGSLNGIVPDEDQLILVRSGSAAGNRFADIHGEDIYTTDALLHRVIRKKQHS